MPQPIRRPSSPTSIREVVLRYRFLFLAVLLFSAGVVLEVVSWKTGAEVVGHFAVALLIAGSAGLGLELYTRKEFLRLVDESLKDVIERSTLAAKIEELKGLTEAGRAVSSAGVNRVHMSREPISFSQVLERAEPNTEIRILGICLLSLARTQHLLEKKLEAGCSIKILLLDPECKAVEERAADEGRPYAEVREEIEASERIHRLFVDRMRPKKLRGNIELRYYDRYPSFFLLATQSLVVVGFYLRKSRGLECPHIELEVKGGGLYEPFLHHFDAAWEESKAVLGLGLPLRH
jgi:hypothetical protein